ncbi:T9SS type A sorting domain-containing protein [Mangrovimonas xylaniphaga]|uniref:T9SS type A sorting domain-containing protein n=1 Tax=Mangrovimonas xylaniphaga TaxID=1645915 RepID=UPI0009EBC5B9|nr:T9SS type A sorting domain-containing protein [Mangrovimonas xylaniphaga]
MKHIYILTLAFLGLFIFTGKMQAQSIIDFNSTADLTTNFNPSSTTTVSNGSSSGISNSGAVNFSGSTNGNWTLKEGFPVALNADYKVSAYVKIEGNAGRGGIGFAVNSANTANTYGHPAKTLGFAFHGGGGDLINNASASAVNWPPDLVLGNWYYMELTVSYISANTFSIDFNIYNSDAEGNLGALKTNHKFSQVTNADLGGATILYPYFCHDGYRLSELDNFYYATFNNALGVEDYDMLSRNISIYPNPSSDYIKVSNLSNREDYSIYDILGKKVLSGTVSKSEAINIQNIPNGLYFVQFENNNKLTLKFIKE